MGFVSRGFIPGAGVAGIHVFVNFPFCSDENCSIIIILVLFFLSWLFSFSFSDLRHLHLLRQFSVSRSWRLLSLVRSSSSRSLRSPIFGSSLWSRRTSLASAFIYRHSACLSVGVILSQYVSLPVSRSSRFFDFVLSLSILVFFVFSGSTRAIHLLLSSVLGALPSTWNITRLHDPRIFCMVYEVATCSLSPIHGLVLWRNPFSVFTSSSLRYVASFHQPPSTSSVA